MRLARKRLAQIERLRRAGKLREAEAACMMLLKEYPDYVAALYNLGVLCDKQGNRDTALYYLSRAAMLCPNHVLTLKALGGIYQQYEAYELAEECYEKALKQEPEDAEVLVKLGQVAWRQFLYEEALGYYQRAASIAPNMPEARIGLGRCLNYLDRHEEAAKILEVVIREGVATLKAMRALRTFPPQFLTADLLSRFGPAAATADSEDQAVLALLKGSLLDRAGRHAEAWESLAAGNRILFREEERQYLKGIEKGRRTLEEMRHAGAAPGRNDSDQKDIPISLFIAGASRSGKTVAERLMAVGEGVARGYESPIVGNCVRRVLQEHGFPSSRSVATLSKGLDVAFAQFYLEDLRKIAGPAKVFINTSPNIVREALGLAQVLPRTRFVFVKRNVDDTVFRIFEKHYAKGNSYAYDLKAAYEYVAWYHEMIDLAAAKLPGRSILLHYEDMVADPAAALMAMTELCGLPPFTGEMPEIGDDRGCATPYREFMHRDLEA